LKLSVSLGALLSPPKRKGVSRKGEKKKTAEALRYARQQLSNISISPMFVIIGIRGGGRKEEAWQLERKIRKKRELSLSGRFPLHFLIGIL